MTERIQYHLRYETREDARCMWCWKLLPVADSHTVISAAGITLRFHHNCWTAYRGLSGIEGVDARAMYRDWSPERIEGLRLHAGYNLEELASKLRISKDRLVNALGGRVKIGTKVIGRLRSLAIDTRFEHTETAGQIDWSDRRACFTLCMRLGWNCGELGLRLDVKDSTVSSWWNKGVPKASVRHWASLDRLAKENSFDSSMLIDDYLWTADLVRKAIADSGKTWATWAALADCTTATFRDATSGRRRINRQMAYRITRAAVQLGIELPPRGVIAPKTRKSRPFPEGFAGPQGAQVWQPEELALLGTMPDMEVSRKLDGKRTLVAVRRMRRLLKIKVVDKRKWDGKPLPSPDPLAELVDRYQKILNRCQAQRQPHRQQEC